MPTLDEKTIAELRTELKDNHRTLIVAAVNALPALLDEREEMQAEIERLRDEQYDHGKCENHVARIEKLEGAIREVLARHESTYGICECPACVLLRKALEK